MPRIPVENVVDTTGCGDSFAAGMAFGYLFGRDIVKACQYGNAMGAQRCAGSGAVDLPAARRDRRADRAHLRPDGGSVHVREALLVRPRVADHRGRVRPERANVRETLCTVGNGYLGTRGTLEEGHPGDLSGTYLAGVYDDHDSPVIDLVNAPDWLSFAVYVDGARLDVAQLPRSLDHERTLDLRTGLLYRRTVFEDADGRRTRLETLRCASIADRHTCALRVEITPENHDRRDHGRERARRPSAQPRTAAGLPGGHRRSRWRSRWEKWALTRHLDRTERVAVGDVAYLEMRTIASGITLGYAATTSPSVDPTLERLHGGGRADQSGGPRFPGGPVRLDKLVRIGTSRDVDGGLGPGRLPRRARAAAAAGFDAIVAASAAAWERALGRLRRARSTATRRAPRRCASASTTC